MEGIREISLAIKGKYEITEMFYTADLFSEEKVENFLRDLKQKPEIVQISREVYEKIAYRGSTEGIIAIVRSRDVSLRSLQVPTKNLLILVAESPEKPGNIGALLRTADAANVDAVLIANPKTDLFNPNIIRSSVGCVFTTRIATGSTAEIIHFLKERDISIYAAALQASVEYHTIDYSSSSAIVVGTEATGLSKEWLQNATNNIVIPMQGEIDSMNVSVAAGILIFEVKRQRGFQ